MLLEHRPLPSIARLQCPKCAESDHGWTRIEDYALREATCRRCGYYGQAVEFVQRGRVRAHD